MKKAVWSGIIVAVGMLALSTPAFAQAASANANVTVNANVNAKAKLTISANNIAFPTTGDPDSNPVLAATSALTIDGKARTSASGNVTLTVLAGGDLDSGSATIAISNLTWTSTGAVFNASGVSNASTAQPVASFSGSGSYSGSQSYSLVNSWAYTTGNYSATLTYTLTAP